MTARTAFTKTVTVAALTAVATSITTAAVTTAIAALATVTTTVAVTAAGQDDFSLENLVGRRVQIRREAFAGVRRVDMSGCRAPGRYGCQKYYQKKYQCTHRFS